ncbi:MAG: hypothetical protein QNL10_06560 [Crocinitomicaceae bacterium]|jgi:hypothetical protein|tara:strand:- start:16464 stop:16955 length:492 start_codon:yes stop_codon:yes gene_type:complete
MAGFFKRNKKSKPKAEKKEPENKVPLRPIQYSNMVILAWAKAVDGNKDLQQWLVDNGYEELVHTTYAIRLKEESRAWLMDNGYAHLMAMINGCEGNAHAQKWLLDYKFYNLYHVARAIDYEQDSWKWLAIKKRPQLAILAKSIQRVKDDIEERHNDIHSMNKD